MTSLLRLLRYRSALRYWRRRALNAEADLKAEMWRNQAREDTFVSAAVMGARGMFGVPPRTGPARQPEQQQPVHPADPWSAMLTGADRLEFETIVWPDAQRANVSRAEAQRHFMETVMQRRQLNDEPFM